MLRNYRRVTKLFKLICMNIMNKLFLWSQLNTYIHRKKYLTLSEKFVMRIQKIDKGDVLLLIICCHPFVIASDIKCVLILTKILHVVTKHNMFRSTMETKVMLEISSKKYSIDINFLLLLILLLIFFNKKKYKIIYFINITYFM